MARPKTEYRNEMTTRVPDATYEAVKAFQESRGFESESRAIAFLLSQALFGCVGTIPPVLSHGYPSMPQHGAKIL